jgi:hypothetical protein
VCLRTTGTLSRKASTPCFAKVTGRGSPKTTPASFGPSPALRLHPCRALSSVTADRIITPPALASKRKIPGDMQGGSAPLLLKKTNSVTQPADHLPFVLPCIA